MDKEFFEFCVENDMIVCNTFFKHRDIHKHTRTMESRAGRSIINLFMVRRNDSKLINDTKVKRSYEIGTDHYLVELKIKEMRELTQKRQTQNGNKGTERSIKVYKLTDEDTRIQYCTKLDYELEKMNWEENKDLETLWKFFKETKIKVGEEICGKTHARKYKHTAWWNNNIKIEVKKKKKLWKEYPNNKSACKFSKYKNQRKIVKDLVKEAKLKEWEEFGNKMEENRQTNIKLLYRTLKNIRTNNKKQVNYIEDVDSNLLTAEEQIAERWYR